MDNKDKIGMFDSGVGGLTVMRQVQKLLPNESIIYFGDTARVPYGEKSRDTIISYSKEIAFFLLEQGIKVLVIACNTAASACSGNRLQQIFNIPVISVIDPAVQRAVEVTKSGRIAVLATRGTVKSGAYQQEITKRLPQATVFPIACPLLVPLVEERMVDHPATRLIVKEYLKPLRDYNVDTLLLGCTHYPLLSEMIQAEIDDQITIVDSATTCAIEVQKQLLIHQLNTEKTKPDYHFYVSDDPENFRLNGQFFLGHPIHKVHSSIEQLISR
jgi:glutamate racemase